MRIVEGGMLESFTMVEYLPVNNRTYQMCTARSPKNFSEELYNMNGEWFATWLSTSVLPRLVGKTGDALLKALAEAWRNHCLVIKYLMTFMSYIDRYHVVRFTLPNILQQSNTKFEKEIYVKVQGRMTAVILAKINAEREGEAVPRDILKSLTDLYCAMSDEALEVYERDFQTPMLAAAKEYYERKGDALVVEMDVPSYLARVEEMLITETSRVKAYMHEHSEPYLRQELELALLKRHQKWVLENERSGLEVMFTVSGGDDDKSKHESLARLYRLYKSDVREAASAAGVAGPASGGLAPIAKIVREHLQALGMAVYKTRDNAAMKESGAKESVENPAFVTALLDMHERATVVVKKDFQDDQIFQKAVKDAFESVINKAPQYSELQNVTILAHFADGVLKSDKKAKEAGSGNVDTELDRVVSLFQYVSDKDVFGNDYRTLLAKRLLTGKSSADHERSMIAKLKFQCGQGYTSKMEGMLNDLTVANELKSEFTALRAVKSDDVLGTYVAPPTFDFAPTILTSGFWPAMKQDTINLPETMLAETRIFEAWYKSKFERRRLQWVLAQGSVDVKCVYGAKSFTCSFANAIQAAVLMLFNDLSLPPLTKKQIEARVGTTDNMLLARALHSLSCQKFKLLSKTPEDTSIKEDDTFVYNAEFSTQFSRFSVAMASEPVKRDTVAADADRAHMIDAAIVRIAKARKVINFTTLVTDTFEQLLRLFKADLRMIKIRIEDLINRVSGGCGREGGAGGEATL